MHARSPSLRALFAVLLGVAAASPLSPGWAQRVGVNAAVNTDANGTPPSAPTRKLVIGQEVVHNERIVTDARGQTQILFLDGSSVSIGPNADLMIDEFIYDPSTGTGKMTLTAVRGAMRFVGGKLSKQDNAVTLHLGTATIGVRGGVFVADIQPNGQTEIVFVYGKAVTVAGQSGCSQSIYRPGFAVDIAGPGGCPGSPHAAPPGATASILTQLDGRTGANGGATNVPTDATVAGSPVSSDISGNLQVSIAQANANAPTPAPQPPAPTAQPPQVPTNQIQIAANPPPPAPPPAPPPTPPAPLPSGIAGAFKDAFTTTTGFENSVILTQTPFIATLSYPASTPGQNGSLTADAGGGFTFVMSPLTAGQTTSVQTPAFIDGSSTGNSANGLATLAADGAFFFANTTAGGGDKVFFFGGTPLASSFFTTTTPTPQFLAFAIQPDYALASGSQPQTIPFLPSFAGGTLGNAVVSPLYVVTQPNSPFGSFNATSNPSGTAPYTLQASLAINGPASNQQDALVVATGSFDTSTTLGSVVSGGPVRGTYMPGGASPLTQMSSAFSTVPDANNNTLFGGSSIDGFVLDQNRTNADGTYQQQDAGTFQVGVANSNTAYGFNQPVLATTLPAGVGANRTVPAESGFFGGLMENGGGLTYALAGQLVLVPNPTNSTLGATFAGTDPFTSSTSGVSALTLQFGTQSGRNFARSTYIDNNIFGATESYTLPVQIVTPGGATITYPTQANASSGIPTAAMVTSATVPGAINSLLPSGVTPCGCQYLQWGYWQANIPASNQGGPSNTVQSSYINTWVAGMPTVNMPATGTGIYQGAAIGTVSNNGVAYLAAGGFNNTYNFGSNTGIVSISNFDGANYAASVTGTSGGPAYSGALSQTGGNRVGVVVGGFAGPGAAETGGTFALHAPSGPSYVASGIFAGKLTGPIH